MAFFAERASLKNIVDPLTKCKRISRDDFRRADPLTKCKRISRDDGKERTFVSSSKTMTGRRKTVDEISKI